MSKKTFIFKHDYTLVFKLKKDPKNPRLWPNHCIMICVHNRYILGDLHTYNSIKFKNWQDLRAFIEQDYDFPKIIKPLYLLDYSGLTLRTSKKEFLKYDPHERDWGQVGFIFMKNSTFKETFASLKHEAYDAIEREVNIYNAYLVGDVWSWELYKKNKLIDSGSEIYGFNSLNELIEKLQWPSDLKRLIKQGYYEEVEDGYKEFISAI